MEATKSRKYRIAVDGHVLLQKEKTGVGQTARYLINELAKNRNIDVQINFVDFFGYRCREFIKEYKRIGCRIRFCWWLPYSIYVKMFEKFKIPYYFLFGKKNDITLFFEYWVPYGIGTKTANYVYDVNYRVYPETVEKSALKWLNDTLPLYCERSDIIITISNFSKKEIERYLGISDRRIQVVPCGVDCDKYKKETSLGRSDLIRKKYGIEGKYILYMGTLEPRKNIAILIEAYQMLAERNRQLPKLVIAGKKGWMYERLYQMVTDFGLKDQIVFTGYIEDDERVALMAAAELFVFPSLYEGFGIPPLEAMACGTPVIVSDAAALLETVGKNAMVFRSGDVTDLSCKIDALLSDEVRRNILRVSGRKWAENYTWKRAGKQLVDALKQKTED